MTNLAMRKDILFIFPKSDNFLVVWQYIFLSILLARQKKEIHLEVKITLLGFV